MKCVKCELFLNLEKCKKQSSEVKDCENFKYKDSKLITINNNSE